MEDLDQAVQSAQFRVDAARKRLERAEQYLERTRHKRSKAETQTDYYNAIVQEVLSGSTLGMVGAEFGISRERVRQIMIEHHDPAWTGRKNMHKRRMARAQKAEAARAEAREHWRTHIFERPNRGFQKVWTDEDALRVLREQFETHGYISVGNWDLVTRSAKAPSSALYIQRFGTWNAAKEAAGLATVPRRQRWVPRTSDETMVFWVARFLREAPDYVTRFSAVDYEAWSAQHEEAPSSAVIRARLRWGPAKQRAIQFNAELEATELEATDD